MSHTTLILNVLFTMAMLVVIAPNIFAINRGHVLRNVALWLAIFLGLGVVYQNFGPNSPHPLFQLPEAMSGMRNVPAENRTAPDATDKDGKDEGEQGYTPPKD
jgi:hypothetical protein